MTLIKYDHPKILGIVTAMRHYAQVKADRNRLILEALDAKIPVWRISDEMDIDRKTIFKVRDENRGE